MSIINHLPASTYEWGYSPSRNKSRSSDTADTSGSVKSLSHFLSAAALVRSGAADVGSGRGHLQAHPVRGPGGDEARGGG